MIRVDETDRAGYYAVSWESPGVGPTMNQRTFAVNPDPAESDLTKVADGVIGAAMEPLAVTVTRVGDAAGDGVSGDRELWRGALLAVLAMVVVESALAAWVGREK